MTMLVTLRNVKLQPGWSGPSWYRNDSTKWLIRFISPSTSAYGPSQSGLQTVQCPLISEWIDRYAFGGSLNPLQHFDVGSQQWPPGVCLCVHGITLLQRKSRRA